MTEGAPRTCVFCGEPGGMTNEHVFGRWMSGLGFSDEPTEHFAGFLNRPHRSFGRRAPFKLTVNEVCSRCNNGWMSKLEESAREVLSPLIKGASVSIDRMRVPAVVAWAQKTALVSMLVSSAEQRADGYGLPPSEYRGLFELSSRLEPMRSQFWVGRGSQGIGAWVSPVAFIRGGSFHDPLPDGYAITISVGQLFLHGIRLPDSDDQFQYADSLGLQPLWPIAGDVKLPPLELLGREDFLALSRGRLIRSDMNRERIGPWVPAVDSPASELDRDTIVMPSLCGEHRLRYPAELARIAMRGHDCLFVLSCPCSSYLIRTKSDGARTRASGSREDITALYDGFTGPERVAVADGIGIPFKIATD